MNEIIKFSAEWCGPCKSMKPHFKKFQDAHSDESINIQDVDIDDNYELALKYEVKSIPHTIFIKDGNVIERISGVANFEKLNDTYQKVFS